jgi:hypothetical protein
VIVLKVVSLASFRLVTDGQLSVRKKGLSAEAALKKCDGQSLAGPVSHALSLRHGHIRRGREQTVNVSSYWHQS